MPYILFHNLFPETAERETRTITVLPNSNLGLPSAHYGFLEMFCDESGCDCRRVFFYVVSSACKDVQAVVAYGWEPYDFYARWMHDDDPEIVVELKGPALDLSTPQSDLAPAILDLIRNLILKDEVYVERVKMHYKMFREEIERKGIMKNQFNPCVYKYNPKKP